MLFITSRNKVWPENYLKAELQKPPFSPSFLNRVVNYSRKPRRNGFETTKQRIWKLHISFFFSERSIHPCVNEFRGKINKYESRFGVDVSFVSVCRPILVGGKEARRTIGKVSFSPPWRIKRKFPHRYLSRVARVFELKGGREERNFRTVR